uniref:Uncharacterized protein n=1 Tax=Rhizophora mucronata TaxID=61149 RepID=A0A2P2M1A2_RHIMU
MMFFNSLTKNIPCIAFHHFSYCIIHRFTGADCLSFFNNSSRCPPQIRINIRQDLGNT